MLNKPQSPTNTIFTQMAGMIAALSTFIFNVFLVAALYFATPLFGLLATSTLTLALGGTGIGLLVIGLSIAAYFIAQAILGAGAGKHVSSMTSGADDSPPFMPLSNSAVNQHSKKISSLNKGASKASSSFEAKDKLATDAVKKPKVVNKAKANSAGTLFQTKANTKTAPATPPFNREKSAAYKAAWHEKKNEYDAAIKQFRATSTYDAIHEKVDALQYLVITGFANEAPLKETEHLQAQSFVRKHIEELAKTNSKQVCRLNACKLIFTAGIDGLSALQLAAAELDIHMVLALLLPFTNNPDEVRAEQQKTADSDNLSPQDQWQQRTILLLNALPKDIRETALAQLQTVKEKNWMVKGKQIKQAYEDCIAKIKNARQITKDNGYDDDSEAVKEAWKPADIAWRFVGKCQATLSRALLLDCYFNPQRSNKTSPHFNEAQLPRVFKFWSAASLFPDLIKKLGLGIDWRRGFGIYRADWPGPWRHPRRARTPDSACSTALDLAAVTHAFEMKPEQLDWIIDQLTLSLDSTETQAATPSLGRGSTSS